MEYDAIRDLRSSTKHYELYKKVQILYSEFDRNLYKKQKQSL